MERLAEDIWKSIWCSLAATVAIVGFLRYFDQDHWWQINTNLYPEEYENGPLVYYNIKGVDKSGYAELFINNVPQEMAWGEYGVFRNVLPGQIVSLRVFADGRTLFSPVFRLEDREIRLLTFEDQGSGLAYLGSHSRVKVTSARNIAVLEPNNKEDLLQLAILKEIEDYKPVAEVEAKVENKNAEGEAAPDNQVENLNSPNRNLFLYLASFYKNLEKQNR